MFKFTYLKVANLGPVVDSNIPLDMPLNILFGDITTGKSTHLKAVGWACGGAFPDDIIRHGQKEGHVELGFAGGFIRREWYRSKEGETKARTVQLIRGGRPVASPVSELKRLVSPFSFDQDFFIKKSDDDRKKFLAELFAVDTTTLDTEAFDASQKAKDLRAKLTGYGDIDLTKVEPVDTAALRTSLATVRAEYSTALSALEAENAKIRSHNQEAWHKAETHANLSRTIVRLRAELKESEEDFRELTEWIAANPVQNAKPRIAPPDTTALESQLQNAAAQNVRAENYKANLAREEKRKADAAALKVLEDRQRDIKKEKIAALGKISATCGVKGLTFDEEGNFLYEGTAAGMLSGSQLMRLSSELAALYPTFGLELIDKAESLGRAIMGYVEYAERTSTSVLATVVGNPPADVPEKVGVWIVKDGLIFDKESAKSETEVA